MTTTAQVLFTCLVQIEENADVHHASDLRPVLEALQDAVLDHLPGALAIPPGKSRVDFLARVGLDELKLTSTREAVRGLDMSAYKYVLKRKRDDMYFSYWRVNGFSRPDFVKDEAKAAKWDYGMRGLDDANTARRQLFHAGEDCDLVTVAHPVYQCTYFKEEKDTRRPKDAENTDVTQEQGEAIIKKLAQAHKPTKLFYAIVSEATGHYLKFPAREAFTPDLNDAKLYGEATRAEATEKINSLRQQGYACKLSKVLLPDAAEAHRRAEEERAAGQAIRKCCQCGDGYIWHAGDPPHCPQCYV